MSLWHIVRLELAPTAQYPAGSAGRAYLLRLPLVEAGLIDKGAHRTQPESATVRRFWPNEPDRSGYIMRANGNWIFYYGAERPGCEDLLHADNMPIGVGSQLKITEYRGACLPFLIVSVMPDYP